ncbi:hypothetical protein BN1211_4154 [Cyberlindnera jadinii]|uniref:AB hydrolase-1 domain-containing protein n=1 Tax=Cyberlindnera jadinii (strain ATCC 18201 / CBS 1600 / BCRC 20928 / JCM 3617 / NBRC 0987 / NRRL Y-1542) TaxID=983966 RepID=A0A0H5C6N4_CYBJN|nr:hypothetical protein BN1211_4154 [Cyberlindnera jadinii]
MRMWSIQSRGFSTSTVALGKTLVEKVRAQPPSRNDMSLKECTQLFWEWLTNSPTKMLKHYEEAILADVKLPEGVTMTKSKVAGLHQIKLTNQRAKISTPTLLVHGHGATGMFFHRDFPDLSANFKELYTVDHPDCGLSDLKKFKVRMPKAKVTLKKLDNDKREFTIEQDVEKNRESVVKVENFYLDAFEKWRQENRLDRLNIVAHSFGAYLSFKYCLKYPHRVNKLVLCSPAGVERSIFSLNNKQNHGIVSQDPSSPSYLRFAYLPWLITTFGFNLAKIFGPFAVQILTKYLSLRYSRGSDNDNQIKLLLRYTVHLWYQNNQSFRNLLVIINNQILSLDPILDNIKQLETGYAAFEELEGVEAKYKIIPQAGHNVFLDNSDVFDSEVIHFLSDETTINGENRI